MSEMRKQLFIKRQFQQGMILEVLLASLIMVNVIIIIGYFMINSISDLHQFKRVFAFTVAAVEIAGMFAIYRYNLKVSHRIAGPIFVIERCLRSLEAGDLSFDMRLRKDDQFQEVAIQMNATLHQLRERISRLQSQVGELQQQAQVNPALIRQMMDELAYFKTEQSLAGEDIHIPEQGPSMS